MRYSNLFEKISIDKPCSLWLKTLYLLSNSLFLRFYVFWKIKKHALWFDHLFMYLSSSNYYHKVSILLQVYGWFKSIGIDAILLFKMSEKSTQVKMPEEKADKPEEASEQANDIVRGMCQHFDFWKNLPLKLLQVSFNNYFSGWCGWSVKCEC